MEPQHSLSLQFSPLQTELFKATGRVFEIGQLTHDNVQLLIEGVHVFSIPATVIQNPGAVHEIDFPEALIHDDERVSTLTQRRLLIQLLTSSNEVQQNLLQLLQQEAEHESPTHRLADYALLERWILDDEIRNFLWKLDDVTVQRWINTLSH